MCTKRFQSLKQVKLKKKNKQTNKQNKTKQTKTSKKTYKQTNKNKKRLCIWTCWMCDCQLSYQKSQVKTILSGALTAHNWQKWKRAFLTRFCHKIYRDEAVGPKGSKYTWKWRSLWKCEIWGNIVKIRYFVNNCLIKARI